MTKAIYIGCRSCGCGGTDITMVPTKEGLKCVWENEELPYNFDEVTLEYVGNTNSREASDGHNVSMISWKELESMLNYAKKKKLYKEDGK